MYGWLLLPIFGISLNLAVADHFGFNVTALRIATTSIIIFLFLRTLLTTARQRLARTFEWIAIPALVTALGAVNAVVSTRSVTELLLFLFEMSSPLMLFVIFYAAPITKRQKQALVVLLLLVFAVQIPVSVAKYVYFGVDEKRWIGTFDHSAGQLGLLMPMIAVSLLWAYAIKKQIVWGPVILIALFSAVGIISEKRSFMLVLPFLLIFLSCSAAVSDRFQHSAGEFVRRFGLGKQALTALGLSLAVAVGSIHFMPSLNTDRQEFKSLKTGTVAAYVREYLTRGYESEMNTSRLSKSENRNIQLGRLMLWEMAIEMCPERGVKACALGEGGGWLIQHPLLHSKSEDFMFEQLELRGPRSTGIRHLFEVGVIGLGLMLLWFAQIAWGIFRRVGNVQVGWLALGALGVWSIQAFDYVLYSEVAWRSGIFTPISLLLIGRVLRLKPRK